MAANQKRTAEAFGFTPDSATAMSTLALSTAGTFLAYGFVSEQAKQLNSVMVYLSAVTGALATGDVQMDIYSDFGGAPNVSVAGPFNPGSVGAATWITFSGITLNLTAGAQYWIVIHNVNASPGTVFPTFTFGSTGSSPAPVSGTTNFYGWAKKHSTNSGTTWGTNVANSCGWRLGFSDSTYDGLPISGISGTPASNRVYAAREHGMRFTVPANAKLNVRGIAFNIRRGGSPTGTIRFKLYTGSSPSLQATTYDIGAIVSGTYGPLPGSGNSGWLYGYFASNVVLNGGDVVVITIAESTQSDTSSNYYSGFECTIENSAGSKGLGPMQGTWNLAYYDGSAWTYTDTIWLSGAVLLDSEGEFGAAAAAGMLYIPNMAGT